MTTVSGPTGSSPPNRRKSSQFSTTATSSVPPGFNTGRVDTRSRHDDSPPADLGAEALGQDGEVALRGRRADQRFARGDDAVAAGAGHADDQVIYHKMGPGFAGKICKSRTKLPGNPGKNERIKREGAEKSSHPRSFPECFPTRRQQLPKVSQNGNLNITRLKTALLLNFKYNKLGIKRVSRST